MRAQEKTLWILCQPVSPVSSTWTRVYSAKIKNARHVSVPNASVAARVNSATVAPAANTVRQRPVAMSTSGIMMPDCGL